MDTESMPAWTLPELLVVMILSGLIFLALSEATDLVLNVRLGARIQHLLRGHR